MVIALALCCVGSVTAAAPAAVAVNGQPWRDPGQPALQRANELLAALTFEQKVAVALGDLTAVASFGVPALNAADGPNGVRADGTTSFPSAQDLASTFDTGLARSYGAAIAAEARGKAFNWWLAPAADIARTPLAGRQPENLGEDPVLAGDTAAATVAGARSGHIITSVKHYVGNNQEYQRFGFQVEPIFARGPAVNDVVSERALRELYERPFRTAVRGGGTDSVMCSYNQVNGVPACENPSTLSALTGDPAFQGFVVPDFIFAVRDVVAAANAGVDMPALSGPGGRTASMFTSGQVSAARLDDIVRRILFAIFDSGLFDDPQPTSPAATVSTQAHLDLATRIAEEGTVLLKNDRHALPLSDRLTSIGVIGPAGTDATFINGGSAAVAGTGQAVTPLAGITARAGSGVRINVAQGSLGDAVLPAVVPSGVLTPSAGTGPGLLATYYPNGEFSGTPTVSRVEPTVDVSSPPAGFGSLWSATWTGTLTPNATGLYRFSMLEAGLAKLYIDGRPVASGYREATRFVAGPQYPVNGTIRLTAGRPVPIRVEYSSKVALFSTEIHLAWQPPEASLIPAAVAAARRSDVAVVFADNVQGEGMDRGTLALPGDQDQLIEAVAAANPRTVVVLNTGGPVLMPWLDKVDAVVQAWYPGQQFGTAIAAVLFGDVDPGGRLPVTYPASDAQGPAPATQPRHYPGVAGNVYYDEGLDVGYRWYDATGQQPLFPFGYGLSYADFHFSDLAVHYDAAHRVATVTVKVKDTGQRSGSTVAQLYLGSPDAAGEPPKQLKAYQKVGLAPGGTATLTFRLGADDLAVFNPGAAEWTVTPGRYTVMVGDSSGDLPLHKSFQVG